MTALKSEFSRRDFHQAGKAVSLRCVLPDTVRKAGAYSTVGLIRCFPLRPETVSVSLTYFSARTEPSGSNYRGTLLTPRELKNHNPIRMKTESKSER